MARINVTGGRTKYWYLCSECKSSDATDTVTDIVDLAKRHLAEAHSADTRTHRVEMGIVDLVALTNAAKLAGQADTPE